ncbi:universal stress protein [Actinomadura meridiana]|uniref:Universal stress protein n=1 Tax=Actinomadura meridiana TaxID=559626 RepID=A0ABP8BUX0_9ACTN
MSAYRVILVGTDGSDSSFRAVDRAARLAAATGASLLLSAAYGPMPARERAAAADRLGDLAYKVQGATPAEDALRAARARAVAAGAGDVDQVAVEGDAADVIARLAGDRGADLVVVGNRGLNTLTGRILGSVPANLSHRSPCDVLIVHTTDGR